MTAYTPAQPKYSGTDRRRNKRYMGQDITLSVDGVEAPVLDISVGGVRTALSGLKSGVKVSLTLTTPDSDPVTTTAEVRGSDARGASLAFVSPTYALMRFVVHYLAGHHGVEVHAFR